MPRIFQNSTILLNLLHATSHNSSIYDRQVRFLFFSTCSGTRFFTGLLCNDNLCNDWAKLLYNNGQWTYESAAPTWMLTAIYSAVRNSKRKLQAKSYKSKLLLFTFLSLALMCRVKKTDWKVCRGLAKVRKHCLHCWAWLLAWCFLRNNHLFPNSGRLRISAHFSLIHQNSRCVGDGKIDFFNSCVCWF